MIEFSWAEDSKTKRSDEETCWTKDHVNPDAGDDGNDKANSEVSRDLNIPVALNFFSSSIIGMVEFLHDCHLLTRGCLKSEAVGYAVTEPVCPGFKIIEIYR